MPPVLVIRNWKKVLKVSAAIWKGTAVVVKALPARAAFGFGEAENCAVVSWRGGGDDAWSDRPVVALKFGYEMVWAVDAMGMMARMARRRDADFSCLRLVMAFFYYRANGG